MLFQQVGNMVIGCHSPFIWEQVRIVRNALRTERLVSEFIGKNLDLFFVNWCKPAPDD